MTCNYQVLNLNSSILKFEGSTYVLYKDYLCQYTLCLIMSNKTFVSFFFLFYNLALYPLWSTPPLISYLWIKWKNTVNEVGMISYFLSWNIAPQPEYFMFCILSQSHQHMKIMNKKKIHMHPEANCHRNSKRHWHFGSESGFELSIQTIFWSKLKNRWA